MALSTGEVISIGAIVVGSGTAFSVAHLHRKQLRQNEAFRQDPSIGLIPPPGPVLAFYRKYQSLILGIALPTGALVLNLFDPSPITRTTIVLMAATVSVSLMNGLVWYQKLSVDNTLRMFHVQLELLKAQSEAIKTHSELIAELTSLLELLSGNVKLLTDAVVKKKE